MHDKIRLLIRSLKEDVKQSPCRDRIVSVILFGSAATDDWVPGRSDIDFLVVCRKRSDRSVVARLFGAALSRAAARVGIPATGLASQSPGGPERVLSLFLRVERLFFQRVPFYVVALPDIDFVNGRIRDYRIAPLLTLFIPVASFVQTLREHGIALYGQNISIAFHPERNWADRTKLRLAPWWHLVAGFIALAVSRPLAVDHAIKATLFTGETVLVELHRRFGGHRNAARQIAQLLHLSPRARLHLRHALMLRQFPQRMDIPAALRLLMDSAFYLREVAARVSAFEHDGFSSRNRRNSAIAKPDYGDDG